MTDSARGSSGLGPALAVALLWAPLPGMAAVWFAVRAERARAESPERFAAAARQARLWVAGSVAFGAVEILGLGGIGLAQWLWALVRQGGAW